MPQEPKKRHSRQRQGKRRSAIRLKSQKAVKCANCGELMQSHNLCKSCGYYDGKQVLTPKKPGEKNEK